MFTRLPSIHPLTVDVIMRRINDNHSRYSAKVEKKKVSEQSYYDARYDGFGKEPTGAPQKK